MRTERFEDHSLAESWNATDAANLPSVCAPYGTVDHEWRVKVETGCADGSEAVLCCVYVSVLQHNLMLGGHEGEIISRRWHDRHRYDFGRSKP